MISWLRYRLALAERTLLGNRPGRPGYVCMAHLFAMTVGGEVGNCQCIPFKGRLFDDS